MSTPAPRNVALMMPSSPMSTYNPNTKLTSLL